MMLLLDPLLSLDTLRNVGFQQRDIETVVTRHWGVLPADLWFSSQEDGGVKNLVTSFIPGDNVFQYQMDPTWEMPAVDFIALDS